jgi:hypothetical protein
MKLERIEARSEIREAADEINKRMAGNWFEIMNEFYPDNEVAPSELLPYALPQMYAIVLAATETYHLEWNQAVDLVRLTIDMIKADDNHDSHHEQWDVLHEIHEDLKGIGLDTMNMVR